MGGSPGGALHYEQGGSFTTQFSAIPLNAWTHLAYVVSGGSISLYINGAFVESDTFTTTPPMQFISFGFFNAGSCCHFPGRLDDMREYNRVLTAAEIKQLYNLGTVIIRE